ncbi:hypothetical protein D3C81_1348710 [compost metagenome]
MAPLRAFSRSGSPHSASREKSVRTGPGLMLFTLMLCGASVSAKLRITASIAPLETLYSGRKAEPRRPAMLDMKTIEPSRRSIICGASALTSTKLPRTLPAITSSNSFSPCSSIGPTTPLAAALSRRASTRPKVASTLSAKARTLTRSAISQAMPVASMPSAFNVAATRSDTALSRPETTTRAPCWPSARAISSPMPLVEPVITATRPDRSNSLDIAGISLDRWDDMTTTMLAFLNDDQHLLNKVWTSSKLRSRQVSVRFPEGGVKWRAHHEQWPANTRRPSKPHRQS